MVLTDEQAAAVSLALKKGMELKERQECVCPPVASEPPVKDAPIRAYLIGGVVGVVVGALLLGLTVAVAR